MFRGGMPPDPPRGYRLRRAFIRTPLPQILNPPQGWGLTMRLQNRPFLSSKNSHFQNEAKCETFVVKMSFICIIIKNHFHINGFALSLALKVRFFGTRKWPIRGPRLYTAVTKHAPSLTSTKLQVWTEEKTLLFSVEATSVNSRRLQW